MDYGFTIPGQTNNGHLPIAFHLLSCRISASLMLSRRIVTSSKQAFPSC